MKKETRARLEEASWEENIEHDPKLNWIGIAYLALIVVSALYFAVSISLAFIA